MTRNNIKSKVYHIPAEQNIENPHEAMRYVLEQREFKLFRNFWKKQLIGIHASCPPADREKQILTKFLRSAAESLKTSDVCAFICETSNRHKKISSNALEQAQEACGGCFDALQDMLPLFMLDGINGNYEYTYKTRDEKEDIHLGGEIPNLGGLVIFSVPFKHQLCGIAGAIFCTGNCLASKRGKIRQYTRNKPQVNEDKCYACKRCLYHCPANAIYLENRHAVIDYEKCIDCGKCVEIARHCGISYEWDATPEHFQDWMIKHASAATDILENKIIYITLLLNSAMNGNLGILISRDPVAIDTAMNDLTPVNGEIKMKDKEQMKRQIKRSKQAGIGSDEYDLIKIAY